MANLISTDIPDTDLQALATASDLSNADLWLADFALDLNVAASDMLSPIAFKTKRLLIFWVMCEICRRNIGKNITTTASGYQTDWYVKKLTEYEKQLKSLMRAVTAAVLTGDKDEYDDTSAEVTTYERG